MTTELFWLTLVILMTALMWMPYILQILASLGPITAVGTAVSDRPTDSAWAERAKRAHVNAVENLVLFAPLVLTAHVAGANSSATATAAAVYFFARLAHYAVYLMGIGLLRTIAFAVGVGAQLTFVFALLGAH